MISNMISCMISYMETENGGIQQTELAKAR